MAYRGADGDDPISFYESLPYDKVLQELERAGIDPQPTVDAVKELIRERLKDPIPPES